MLCFLLSLFATRESEKWNLIARRTWLFLLNGLLEHFRVVYGDSDMVYDSGVGKSVHDRSSSSLLVVEGDLLQRD